MSRAAIERLDAPQGHWQGYAVWRIGLDHMDVEQVPAEALCDFEWRRAERFRFARDRHRYLAAHWGLRLVLAEALGTGPKSLPLNVGARGKPALTDGARAGFNLSHSAGVAVVAVSHDHAELGVDIECLRPIPDTEGLVDVHFSTAERRAWQRLAPTARATSFLTTWTRKEAALKALGTGLSIDARQVECGSSDACSTWKVDVAGQRGLVDIEPSLLLEGAVVSLARFARAEGPRSPGQAAA